MTRVSNIGSIANSALRRLYVVVLIFAFSCGCAQESIDLSDEATIKKAAEQAAILDICPDTSLLEVVSLELSDCPDKLTLLASACWHVMDEVVRDYRFEKSESDRTRFLSMTVLLSSCLRGELVRQKAKAVRESRD